MFFYGWYIALRVKGRMGRGGCERTEDTKGNSEKKGKDSKTGEKN